MKLQIDYSFQVSNTDIIACDYCYVNRTLSRGEWEALVAVKVRWPMHLYVNKKYLVMWTLLVSTVKNVLKYNRNDMWLIMQ